MNNFSLGLIKFVVRFPIIIRLLQEASYFPEKQRKSLMKRFFDLFLWAIKYGEINKFYNLYGQDVLEYDFLYTSYMDYNSFMQKRNYYNYKRFDHPQTVLLRDKFLFYHYLERFEIPVPSVFARYQNGIFYDEKMNIIDKINLKQYKDYFIKDTCGECASFVKHIDNYKELLLCQKDFSGGKDIIFQERIVQSDSLNTLNSSAVNTMRIVTFKDKDGRIQVFAAELRIGTEHTGAVDNAAAGGIMVGIKKDGSLRKWGLIKPGHGKELRLSKHPDSGVVFEEFNINDYAIAEKIVKDAHRLFYNVHSIGWDVAFTEGGPVILEGNDNWEITGLQACNGGLRRRWLESLP